ncbi:TPA: NADH-quinone oxidoreductase subunit NuoB [Candidatus Bathyarchaeota archaeon]|nr:NADH-quinone oxidoreductase subunit NuoB [Candidatus Bathyarchaeota archaeon]
MRLYSPWVYHLHTGGCNGCDIELAAALTPRFDVERFGIILVGSPRHADVLVVTGPVTKQVEPFLKRVYSQTPNPKVVVAIGSCAISGGVYNRDDGEPSYAIVGGVDRAIPVDAYVPGCPPKPEAIIQGVLLGLQKLSKI